LDFLDEIAEPVVDETFFLKFKTLLQSNNQDEYLKFFSAELKELRKVEKNSAGQTKNNDITAKKRDRSKDKDSNNIIGNPITKGNYNQINEVSSDWKLDKEVYHTLAFICKVFFMLIYEDLDNPEDNVDTLDLITPCLYRLAIALSQRQIHFDNLFSKRTMIISSALTNDQKVSGMVNFLLCWIQNYDDEYREMYFQANSNVP
jgi:hypothetical protein